MGKSLVIVESPGKIRTIQGYLGKDYVVKASVGHCYEIAPGDDSVDLENQFDAKYSVIKGKEKVVKELRELSKTADVCYIASDPDREGEAIGWHIAHRALHKEANIKRITFQEITKPAILKALKSPGTLNKDLYEAQQARSIVDRLVGYKVSPFLWRYIAKGTSAGRVQSIGLRLITERQKEIDDFKPEEYWTILGDFKGKAVFQANYQGKPKSEEETNKILTGVKKAKEWKVGKINRTQKSRPPFPVFQTSTLQQFCASAFGWSAKRTMQVAQKVYEAGLITYHRTDSTNISKEAITEARKLIKTMGSKYLPPKARQYKSRNKNAQEAHEGIRPSHLDCAPGSDRVIVLDAAEKKLYDAIYRRFVSCQMTDAKFDHTKVVITDEKQKYKFAVNGQIQVFDGFLKVYGPYFSSKDAIIPDLAENEVVELKKVDGKQHFTKPPAHYNDASLVKALEEKGIGRPSTYAGIIETLKKRKYVEDSKTFTPTQLGKQVCEFLVKAFPELMTYNYTARIEDDLDEIANSKKVWHEVVAKFWKELEKHLQGDSKEIGKKFKQENVTDILCPKCKKNHLVIRYGKVSHKAFYGCEGFKSKECDAMFQIGENNEPIEVVKKEKTYIEGKTCECGGRIVLRKNRRNGNEFGGCEKFPKCRKTYTAEGDPIEPK